MRRLAARLREAGHLPIEARVGVNTGEVVVRSTSLALAGERRLRLGPM